MGDYTKTIEIKTDNIEVESDEFKEQLIDIVSTFRGVDEAIDEFIVAHGYTGDIKDTKAKIDYIKSRLKNARISTKYQYYSGKTFDKTPAFELCFAFELDINESEDVFRKICLKRGFDCHSIKEAIYYYCIKNHLPYAKAMELIDRAPEEPSNAKIDYNADVLFTGSIIEELNNIANDDELIEFFNRNIDQFGYNNATAKSLITRAWKELVKEDGIITNEIQLSFSAEECESIKLNNTYNCLLAILGIDRDNELIKDSDRSIKNILKDNDILHKSAEKEFPDRISIEKIIDGKMVDDEKIRKVMILIFFYRYFAKRIIEEGSADFIARYDDALRCQSDINKFLEDAGYPSLYMGNPYDWIFLFSMYDENPLYSFRFFINELSIVKDDRQDFI